MAVEEKEIPLFSFDSGRVTVIAPEFFLRGDCNSDNKANLADAVYILKYLFNRGQTPDVMDSADSNDDGKIDLADAIYILSYQFSGGPAPKPPFPDPGYDMTPDNL